MSSRIRLTASLAGALMVGASASTPVSAAPVSFGESRYDLILDNQVSWTDARDDAASAGGTLAVITSAEEQSFIESLLTDRNAPTGSYWFGLQETATEGVYAPLGGDSLSYNNFSANEPNNGQNIGESVGGIYWTTELSGVTFPRRGEWNDLPVSGYPDPSVPDATQPDLFRAGYLVEFANGDGGPGNGGGNGGGNPIPLPAAALAFPGTALIAYLASRRLRRI